MSFAYVNCICSDLLRDEIMESKLEAVMALAALLQVCINSYYVLHTLG